MSDAQADTEAHSANINSSQPQPDPAPASAPDTDTDSKDAAADDRQSGAEEAPEKKIAAAVEGKAPIVAGELTNEEVFALLTKEQEKLSAKDCSTSQVFVDDQGLARDQTTEHGTQLQEIVLKAKSAENPLPNPHEHADDVNASHSQLFPNPPGRSGDVVHSSSMSPDTAGRGSLSTKRVSIVDEDGDGVEDVPVDRALGRTLRQTLKDTVKNRRRYIRFIVIPFVTFLCLLFTVPVARVAFNRSDESRWWAACFRFVLSYFSTLVIILPYRQAYLHRHSFKPLIPLRVFGKIYLIAATVNGGLAFLQNAWAPKDQSQRFNSDVTSSGFDIADTVANAVQFAIFFMVLPLINYVLAKKYHAAEDLPKALGKIGGYVDDDGVEEDSVVGQLEDPYDRVPSNVPRSIEAATRQVEEEEVEEDGFSWMNPTVVLVIMFTFAVLNLARQGVNIFAYSPAFIALWGLALYLDRDHSYKHRPAYMIMVSFSTIALPLAGSRAMWDLLQSVRGNQGLQFLVVFLWNVLMFIFDILLRRTIRITYDQRVGSAFAFVFAIQFFDDLFVALAFLEVETFNVVFFFLLVWQILRDYLRDTGMRLTAYFFFVQNVLGQEVSIQDKIIGLCEQVRVTDQNLTSELVAAIMVPIAIGMDKLFDKLGVGEDSITFRRIETVDTTLYGYALLFGIQLICHSLVRWGLHHKQRNLVKTILFIEASTKPSLKRNTHPHERGAVLKSALMTQFWEIEKEMVKHWGRQLVFFVAVVGFASMQAAWVVSELRHRDFT